MKTLILFFGIGLILSTSCKKEVDKYYPIQPDYTNINCLSVVGDVLWVISSKPSSLIDFTIVLPPYEVSKINLKDNKILIASDIPAISSMAFDRVNQPYLATFNKSILKLNPDLSFDQYLTIPKISSIQSMIFDKSNNLWVGTYEGGLFYYNGHDTLRYKTSNSILTDNSIESMTIDSEFNIWFIQSLDLFKIDSTKTMTKDPAQFPLNWLAGEFNLSSDKFNSLWVSRWDGNFERLFKKDSNGQWIIIDPPKSSNNRSVRFIKSDNNGTIWIAYENSPKDILAYYDDNKWIEIQIPLDKIGINDIATYNNLLFIGTANGIFTLTL
jgi:hypothetical protein